MIPEHKIDALFKGSLWNRNMTTYCIVSLETYIQNNNGSWQAGVSFIPVEEKDANITYVMSLEDFSSLHEPI